MVTFKEEKENFVTGFEGTSPQELLLVCSTAPIGWWFYLSFRPYSKWGVLLEAVSFWIPMVLTQTNLLYPWGLCYLGFAVFSAMLMRVVGSKQPKTFVEKNRTTRTAMTVYRSCMLYLTFVAILAVDFHVFPRRFVKTEVRGYGLMDLGAASFAVAAGLVSPRARDRPVRISWMRTIPLLLIGIIRLATHKGIEYQEHASEYGVHWNFLFTLAALSVIAAILPGPGWVLPIAMMGLYQAILSSFGVQSWVEVAPRTCAAGQGLVCDLFVANREGILGCIGFAALYLMSEWIGHQCLWHANRSKSALLQISVGLAASWRILLLLGVDVSRRTTNATFCVWAMLVNILQLAAIQMVAEADTGVGPPAIFAAVNRRGLVVFVIANLLTGIVNLCVNTLEVNDGVAIVVLVVYICIVGITAVAVDWATTKLKKD